MKRALALVLLILLLAPLVLADEYEGEEDEYEAGYTAFAVVGVAMIATGVVYYSLTKRKLLIIHKKASEWGFEIKPEQPYVTVFGPIYPLTIHHALTITGTLLVFVHFFSCDNYSGLAGITGLSMAITLVLLNVSGFVGRYIHGKVTVAAKKHDSTMAKKFVKILGNWKKVHIALAVIFAILLLIHLNAVD
ncbi:hypothetical protein E3E35_03300 [Thermococcus sp. GR7]|uniref:hypothetical protein n=1 Tax=unclassified Thermococcus TaxID=2627626 RepID=UPI00142F8230|nr:MULTISPECIES: hypothetical protein [unclassified Thermococcus]NJE46455.1 hypothetical protein [Thermococcus sp. GR7]NJE77626.1 hypothetical protein [Thermococcus sp. GR4]NJF23919.1 hypothetical protein [Thermococcus sp. GR5]